MKYEHLFVRDTGRKNLAQVPLVLVMAAEISEKAYRLEFVGAAEAKARNRTADWRGPVIGLSDRANGTTS